MIGNTIYSEVLAKGQVSAQISFQPGSPHPFRPELQIYTKRLQIWAQSGKEPAPPTLQVSEAV